MFFATGLLEPLAPKSEPEPTVIVWRVTSPATDAVIPDCAPVAEVVVLSVPVTVAAFESRSANTLIVLVCEAASVRFTEKVFVLAAGEVIGVPMVTPFSSLRVRL